MSAESDIVKKVAVKFSDTEYVINRHKDDAISVLQDGKSCDNVKNALRTINQEKDLGLTDEQFKSSNTRSIGKQIMDLLGSKNQETSQSSIIKIEVYFEEGPRVVNILDVPINKNIDTSNFNSDSYSDIISENLFLKNCKQCIENSDSWSYDVHRTDLETMGDEWYDDWDENMNFDYVKSGIENGDPYMVRVIGCDDLDLSFLSVTNNDKDKNEKHEKFLNGTIFEDDLKNEDFSDSYFDCMNENLLALEYIFTSE